ncbi:MAG: response regulator [Rhodospirillaceae bacterium]|jgi:phosphoserine phosphatase RsbU/P|nr:response regulator [Rhodospirillales bacterium]MBT3904239.1 response regulator [Rhodospirillaceae bacterium]MBT4701727.1 response regulator [Rhodospirillaceae bacterium]MBT5034770.1 response regulator [Rhodospirillaceae bacterium]MBT6218349.1 response regulator [Rhodospirillaceae bacterium]
MKASVLVIDDDEINRAHLKIYLDDAGYDVVEAEDGPEALELLSNRNNFSAILLDKNMPKMDGFDVLRKIKATEDLRNIPVIMQTAVKDTERVAEGIKAGAYYYLTKPYDPSVMLTIVSSAIDDSRLYRNLREDLNSRKEAVDSLRLGHFQFQTISQAHDVSKLVALTCPEPDAAIIGLVELMLNAVEHGNLGISYDEKTDLKQDQTYTEEIDRRHSLPEYASKMVDVWIVKNEGEIEIRIEDQGDGFDWTPYLKFDPSRGTHTHGRGIAMAGLSGFSSMEYQGSGNKVVIKIATS